MLLTYEFVLSLKEEKRYWFSYFQIPYFRNFKFVGVCTPVGTYFYKMYIVKKMKLRFPLKSSTNIYFHVYIISYIPIQLINVSVMCQSECACLIKQ